MRTLKATSILAISLMLLFSTLTTVLAQRGGRGRGGGAQLDAEHILENFDEIVSVIWTDEEEDAWDDARNDEARQAFITAFWQRRDPTPETEANEFRDVYMGRVNAAMQFRGEGVEGYRTDRGKVLLIYGGNAVTAIEQRQGGGEMVAPNTRGGGEDVSGAAGRGQQQAFTWAWTMNTDINPFLEGKDELMFRPFQGTFPLSTRGVELSEEAFLANADVQQLFEAQQGNPAALLALSAGAPGDAPNPEAAAMQSLMEEGVTTTDLSLQQDFSYFPGPDNNTYTVFAFEIGKADLTFEGDAAGVRAFGLVMRTDDGGAETVVHQIDASFEVTTAEGDADESGTHTFGATLVPGQHRIAWGVMDVASSKLTTVSEGFEVPALAAGEGMRLTSVAMAGSQMRQTQEPIDTQMIYDVMRIGGLELDVDIDRVFGRSQNIALLYFCMGAEVDPATGQYNLEVTHRVLMEDGQSIAKLPTQTLPYTAIAQSIPLSAVSAIEAGNNYSIEIHIKDLTNGNELTEQIPFSVASQ